MDITHVNADLAANAGTKTIFGLVTTVIAYMWGQVTTLIIVLAFLMILDYITGVIAGMVFKPGGSFDKDKAITGVFKKVLYAVLMAVAFMADYVIFEGLAQFGVDLGVNMALSLVVTLYLIGTEGLSCLQNLIVCGVPVPPFILKVFGLMKDQSGKIIKIPEIVEGGGDID